MREKILLDGKWLFRLDRDNRGVKDEFFSRPMRDAEEVLIPHTYNVGSNTDEYRGPAWYQYSFEAPESWRGKTIRITFRGVYRDADIWLNGNKAGSHYGA
jgi:beta-galactosidase